MTLWPEDNASDYLKGMFAYAEKLAAQARSLDQALAETATTVRRPELEITVQDVVIERLEFTRDVSRVSRIALREKVLEAYHEAQALSLNRQGNAVARTTGSPAIVAETQERAMAAGDESGRDIPYEIAEPVGDVVVTRADLDAMPDPLEEGLEIEDFDTFLRELGWSEATRTPGDPSMWQRNLEREIEARTRVMDQLRPQIAQLEAEATVGPVTVTVRASGELRNLMLTDLAASSAEQLGQDVMQAYSEAANQAADQVEQLLVEHGVDLHDDEDPDLPDPFTATYRRVPRPEGGR